MSLSSVEMVVDAAHADAAERGGAKGTEPGEGAQQLVLSGEARIDGHDDVPVHATSIARRRRPALTKIKRPQRRVPFLEWVCWTACLHFAAPDTVRLALIFDP
jgi:hypothetical protein